MKANKIKNITIIALALLLVMSIFTQTLFFILLGINSVDSFKRVMLANEMLMSMSSLEFETTPISSDVTTSIDTSANYANTNNASGSSIVVLNTNDVKITFVAVEYDTFWESYKLKFEIENNSNTDIIITSAEEVVDGFMVDTTTGFYCEVLKGRKAVDYLTLYNFDLESVGIDKPGVFEFKLNITASDDLFNTIASSDKITVDVT